MKFIIIHAMACIQMGVLPGDVPLAMVHALRLLNDLEWPSSLKL